ncbi:hypothetical protein VUR80DRAFT_8631 [Thermomyces stellatus]
MYRWRQLYLQVVTNGGLRSTCASTPNRWRGRAISMVLTSSQFSRNLTELERARSPKGLHMSRDCRIHRCTSSAFRYCTTHSNASRTLQRLLVIILAFILGR